MVVTKSLWSSPNQFGQTKTILDRPKLSWSHRRTRHKCSLIKISTHCQRVLSVSFPLMQSSSYVWSRESAELRAESQSGSNAGQSSKARSNKKFLQLYFSEAKSKFSTHFKLYFCQCTEIKLLLQKLFQPNLLSLAYRRHRCIGLPNKINKKIEDKKSLINYLILHS